MIEFKSLPGFPGYEMSSDGRAWKVKLGKRSELKPIENRFRKGYMQIAPYADGRNRTLAFHRAMMIAFVGPRPAGMEVAHLDGDKKNNAIDNLVYVSPVENNRHKISHGTHRCGEQCGTAKLTIDDVVEVRRLYETGEYSQLRLAKMFGVTQTPISLLIRRKTWRHLA